ncbi:hypothetical protein AYI69_g10844 [Smittium culicis]|uniref:Uncharacterized protein n=1 Tax=Smittium culicis TaxID=133412 RepID=A0A1R1X332_9FUNG|nr:hypothetical protein AYI69_g10844 [Smittium culicis]
MITKKPFKRSRNTFSDALKGNISYGNAKPTILKKNEPKKIKSIFRYDQKIDMSQYRDVSVKHLLYEEDITVFKIPNLGDVDILTLLDLTKETVEPISEIIDISDLCRKGLTEFLPYGVKILLKNKSAETIIPSFLDYEYGRINIFYRGCKKACSYCKQERHWKSGYKYIEPSAAEIPHSETKESDKVGPPERCRGTIGLKRPLSGSDAIVPVDKLEKNTSNIEENYIKSDMLST